MSSCEAVEFLVTLLSTVLCGKSGTANKPQQSINFLRLHGNMEQEVTRHVTENFTFHAVHLSF